MSVSLPLTSTRARSKGLRAAKSTLPQAPRPG